MRICRICGKQMAEGEHFCSGCGIASDVEWVDRRKIWQAFIIGLLGGLLVCAVIVAILAMTGVFCGGKDKDTDGELSASETGAAAGEDGVLVVPGSCQFEGEGFDSPEEAARAYLEAMQRGNVDEMVSTFAVETFVEHFDMEAMISVYGCYQNSFHQMLDTTDSYTQGVNVARRYGNITGQLSAQYLLLNGYEEDIGKVVMLDKDEEIGDFVAALNNPEWMEILAEMEIGKIYVDDQVTEAGLALDLTSDGAQKNLSNRCEMYGCGELALVLTEVKIDGKDYFFAMDVACYDGVWYNLQPNGILAGMMGIDVYHYGFALQSDY